MSYMDKDVDLLVRSHEMARDRARKGLSPWAGELKIKHLLSADYDEKSELIAACKAIAVVCRKEFSRFLDITSKKYDRDLDGALEILESAQDDDFEDLEDLQEHLNYAIKDIYDFCDMNRIWVC